MNMDETIRSLKEALKFSPDNLPLRKHLSELLFTNKRYDEAEEEIKETLKLSPADISLKLTLGLCFFHLGKYNAAQIILEEMEEQNVEDPLFYMLNARLLYFNGQHEEARNNYRIAIARDTGLQDAAFEKELEQTISAKPKPVKLPVMDEDDEDAFVEPDMEKPGVNFNDVGGMAKVKEEIALKVIHPLKNPDLYKAYGKKIGGGILMYGPPGCGKTLIARATAGEINAKFMSIGLNDVLDMYIGNSEKNLHKIFEQARKNKPCVVFFDEVDALGASRADMRRSNGRFVINQFLNELDGANHNNEGVLILAATNSPWYLDSAFKRPGRFDRLIFIPPPDKTARVDILRLLLKNKPTDDIDYETLAKATDGYSGADLSAVVDIAVEELLSESIRQNKTIPVNTRILKRAAEKHKPTTKEWFSTARNYALYSNEGGQYDDILNYMGIKK